MKFPAWVPALFAGLLLLLGSVFAAALVNAGQVRTTDGGGAWSPPATLWTKKL